MVYDFYRDDGKTVEEPNPGCFVICTAGVRVVKVGRRRLTEDPEG